MADSCQQNVLSLLLLVGIFATACTQTALATKAATENLQQQQHQQQHYQPATNLTANNSELFDTSLSSSLDTAYPRTSRNVHCVRTPAHLGALCGGSLGWAPQMRLPNLLGHRTVEELDSETFWSPTPETLHHLVHQLASNQLECKSLEQLKLLVCATVTPHCLDVVLPPCRQLCLRAKQGCKSALKSLNLEWPRFLDCRRFPSSSNDVCIGRQPRLVDRQMSPDPQAASVAPPPPSEYPASEQTISGETTITTIPTTTTTTTSAPNKQRRKNKKRRPKTSHANATSTPTTISMPMPSSSENTTTPIVKDIDLVGSVATSTASNNESRVAAATADEATPRQVGDSSAVSPTSSTTPSGPSTLAAEQELRTTTTVRPQPLENEVLPQLQTTNESATTTPAQTTTTTTTTTVAPVTPTTTLAPATSASPYQTSDGPLPPPARAVSTDNNDREATTTTVGLPLDEDLTRVLCSGSPDWLIKAKLSDSQLASSVKRRKFKVRSYRRVFGVTLPQGSSSSSNNNSQQASNRQVRSRAPNREGKPTAPSALVLDVSNSTMLIFADGANLVGETLSSIDAMASSSSGGSSSSSSNGGSSTKSATRTFLIFGTTSPNTTSAAGDSLACSRSVSHIVEWPGARVLREQASGLIVKAYREFKLRGVAACAQRRSPANDAPSQEPGAHVTHPVALANDTAAVTSAGDTSATPTSLAPSLHQASRPARTRKHQQQQRKQAQPKSATQ